MLALDGFVWLTEVGLKYTSFAVQRSGLEDSQPQQTHTKPRTRYQRRIKFQRVEYMKGKEAWRCNWLVTRQSDGRRYEQTFLM